MTWGILKIGSTKGVSVSKKWYDKLAVLSSVSEGTRLCQLDPPRTIILAPNPSNILNLLIGGFVGLLFFSYVSTILTKVRLT
jgi:hypothetical protein